MSDQAEALRRLAEHARGDGGRARVIPITSGKGGVGKTNLAVNLAICLSRLGYRTGVLDGDLGMANVDLLLGVAPEFNLSHVLYGQKSLEEIMIEGPEGISVFAGGSGVYELANLSQWTLQRFVRSVRVLDDDLDVLVIDTGAGLSRNVMSFVLASDEVIVVTTPEVTAITDAYGLIKLLATENADAAIRVVVNLARSEREAESVMRSLRAVIGQFVTAPINLELLGYIPPDPAVGKAVQAQAPFAVSFPHSRASLSVQQIAVGLTHKKNSRPPAGIGALFQRMATVVRRARGK